jgi:hypothetical protein
MLPMATGHKFQNGFQKLSDKIEFMPEKPFVTISSYLLSFYFVSINNGR